MSSSGNNTSIPLAAGATFTGAAQLTTGFTNILVSVKVDKKSELTIQQSANKTHWDLDSIWTCDPANDPYGFTIQTPVALPYFRVKLENTTAQNMTALRLVSVLNLTSNVKLTPQQDNTLVSGEDADKKKHTLQTTSTGDLIINGTGGSATRNVHYLVVGDYYRVASIGVTSGAEWNAIGAIVAGESEPTIGRLFKCLSIGQLFAAGGTCYDVEYTDTVSVSVPAGITGSVDILPATDPSLTIGKVRVADFYGDPITTTAGNLNVNLNAISTATALHTIVDSGSVSVSNFPGTQPISGSVSLLAAADATLTVGKVRVADFYGDPITTTAGNLNVNINAISTALPAGTNSIGTVITDEKSATSAPFVTTITNGTSITVSSSANTKLISFNPVNQGAVTTIAWYKFYNGLSKTSADTADIVATFGITSSLNNSNPLIHLSSLLFPNGISVRATGSSAGNDNSAPTGTQSLTAVIYV